MAMCNLPSVSTYVKVTVNSSQKKKRVEIIKRNVDLLYFH